MKKELSNRLKFHKELKRLTGVSTTYANAAWHSLRSGRDPIKAAKDYAIRFNLLRTTT